MNRAARSSVEREIEQINASKRRRPYDDDFELFGTAGLVSGFGAPADDEALSASEVAWSPDALAAMHSMTEAGKLLWESSCEENEVEDVIVRRRAHENRKRNASLRVRTRLRSTHGIPTSTPPEATPNNHPEDIDSVFAQVRECAQLAHSLWTGTLSEELTPALKRIGNPYPPSHCFGCNWSNVSEGNMTRIIAHFYTYLAANLGTVDLDVHCRRVHELFKRLVYPYLPAKTPMWRSWHIRHHFLFHSNNAHVVLYREMLRTRDLMQRTHRTIIQNPALNPKEFAEFRNMQKQLLHIYAQDPAKFAFNSAEAPFDMKTSGALISMALPSIINTPDEEQITDPDIQTMFDDSYK